MKDIVITINPANSTVKPSNIILGVQGEHLQRKLIVEFSEEFIDGTATLEYKRHSGTKGTFALTKSGQSYSAYVDNNLTAETPSIKCQVKIVQATTEAGTPIFKSKVFELNVSDSIDE